MKNGYDHHEHQDIYTYNLSVPRRFTLDVPNQPPPYLDALDNSTTTQDPDQPLSISDCRFQSKFPWKTMPTCLSGSIRLVFLLI